MKTSLHLILAIFLFLFSSSRSPAADLMSEREMDDLLGKPAPKSKSAAGKTAEEQQLDDLLGGGTSAKPKTEGAQEGKTPAKASVKEESSNPILRGLEKSAYQLRSVMYGFTSNTDGQKPGDDTKDVQGHNRVTMDSAFDFADYFRLKTDARLEYGSEDDTYIGQNPFWIDEDNRTRIFDFDQFYIRNKLDDLELIFGKQRVDLGVNALYSPANATSPVDATRPMDPFRLGIYQAGAVYYYGKNSTEFRWYPFFQRSKTAAPTSRWSASGQTMDPTTLVTSSSGFDFRNLSLQNLTVSASEDEVYNRADRPSFLFRQKSTVESVDLFAQTYYGYIPEPVLKQIGPAITQKTYARGFIPAAGASTILGKVNTYGELAAVIPEAREIDTRFNPALGADYDFNTWWEAEEIDRAKLVLEYSHQILLEGQNNSAYPVNNRLVRPGRNTIFAVYDMAFLKDWRFYYGTTVDAVSRFGYTCRTGLEYKCKGGWTTTLSYQWFDGERQSTYGEWANNEYIMLEIVKKF
ncbi:MAG: hypothetical protein HY360_00125 [Verrucomicrobia bacterium]|nr:hypothetical protein [Verrucomicrobiota bacterium]